ncbi:hypothetical protein [Methylomusa anaerophila]|uniref:hypothetical protein n=1 Tax=Methylomusa anaerophila TaxID=1930071 RepID=UPI002D1FB951|nr:hypothetical protein [Methylomusa anaerophila]
MGKRAVPDSYDNVVYEPSVFGYAMKEMSITYREMSDLIDVLYHMVYIILDSLASVCR